MLDIESENTQIFPKIPCFEVFYTNFIGILLALKSELELGIMAIKSAFFSSC